MCATTPRTARSWKAVFQISELFVVLACLYGLSLRLLWRFETADHPIVLRTYRALDAALVPMLWAFWATLLFLLLVSPFFVKPLPMPAMRAWIIGAGGLVAFLLLAFWPW